MPTMKNASVAPLTTGRTHRLWLLLALLVLVLVGCVPPRIGVSWPDLGTVDVYNETKIAVVFNNQVELLEPANGAVVRLQNAEGEVRFDQDGNPRLWRVDGANAENAQFYATPYQLDPETLLFPAYNNRLLTVDEITSDIISPSGIPVPGSIIAPITANDELFFIPLKTLGLAAVERDTEAIRWQMDTERTGVGVWASPLLTDDVLYVPAFDHYLHALDPATGESLWPEPVDLEGGIVSTPLLYDDHLYVGSFSHKLYKLDLDGRIIGTYEAENWIWHTPVERDGILYFADLSGFVHAVDAESMQEVWSRQVAERGIRPAPLVTDEYVIVASRDGILYWLLRGDGLVNVERELDGRPEILSDILFVPQDEEMGVPVDLVVVGTADLARLVYAFDLDGRALWTYGR